MRRNRLERVERTRPPQPRDASVNDAQAALSTDETNLSKASIRAPSDGVILTRSVDPGNAVAASLQAVTLFTVAEDLKLLRLQVYVDEADVGSVSIGQNASFAVSAYPGRKYPARITRVAFGSTITDNVVTYLTYLDVDNSDLSLRPGMTATATITAMQRDDVLLVPNRALRFSPTAAAGGAPAAAKGGIVSSLTPRMPRRTDNRKSAAEGASTAAARQVWVLRDGIAVSLADELTGNLETQRSREIMELLRALNVDHGITVLMVTHEPDMAAYARRMVHFVDGSVESDIPNPNPVPADRLALPVEMR